MEGLMIDKRKRAEEKQRKLEQRRKEVVRRAKLFIDNDGNGFSDSEYRACRSYCRDTFRMVLDLLNTLQMQIAAREKRVSELEDVLISLGMMDEETKKLIGGANIAA